MTDRSARPPWGANAIAPHGGQRLMVLELPPCGAKRSWPAVAADTRPRHVLIPVGTVEHPVTAARRAVCDHCRGRVPDPVIDDLRIIVSELVANVLEHGGGTEGLSIELTIRETEVDVHVIGHGDRRLMPPLEHWHLPPATQCDGRGLALVRRLSRWVTVDGDDPVREHDGWISITATLPLRAG